MIYEHEKYTENNVISLLYLIIFLYMSTPLKLMPFLSK